MNKKILNTKAIRIFQGFFSSGSSQKCCSARRQGGDEQSALIGARASDDKADTAIRIFQGFPKGYTLIEVLVAIGLFSVLMIMIGVIMVNFTQAEKKQRFLNELYDESGFLLERIVMEARAGTIDYAEYYSKSLPATVNYGDNPGEYEDHFYLYYLNGKRDHEGYFDTEADMDITTDNRDDEGINGYEQNELYLLSGDGETKIILKRINNHIDEDRDGLIDEDQENDADDDGDGQIDEDAGLEFLGITKMVLADADNDGTPDSWTAHPDFTGGHVNQADCEGDTDTVWINNKFCLKFFSLTPPTLQVKKLRFFVSPLDDPRKAFKEEGKEVQMQPHITIFLETALGDVSARGLTGAPQSFSLQTTVSSRVYNNVLFP